MLKEHNRSNTRAFTLVELIVVVLIIAVVIAISLPALGMARQAAKKAKSQMLATNLGTAIASYENDKSRLPGYFSAAEMGASENKDRGFTALENAMLDLIKGGMVDGSTTGPSIKEVGPTNADTVFVDLDLLGANTSSGSYFVPEAKAYVAQDGVKGGLKASTEADHEDLPDLVDAFGTPVLLWVENAATKNTLVKSTNNTAGIPFALVDSGSSMNDAARYYWASNAGFLGSTRLGELGRTQVFPGTNDRYSLIGKSVPAATIEDSLMGMLGSPSNANVDTNNVTVSDIVPTSGRGGFTIQLAGPDGMYLASNDKGATRLENNTIDYWKTWYINSTTRVTDDNGNPSSKDLIQGSFDDFLLSGAH